MDVVTPCEVTASVAAPAESTGDPSVAAIGAPTPTEVTLTPTHVDGRSAKGQGKGKRGGPDKRRGGAREPWGRPATDGTAEPRENSEPRQPKRKVALLMSFCGTDYQGMQINDNARTIEGELFQGLVKAGAVSQANADSYKKISLGRAARTDKGVHAAGQVVSCKIIVEDPDIVTKINAALPPAIRVWNYARVVGSFDPRKACDSRIYEYLLPTYVFLPPRPKPDPMPDLTAAAAAGERGLRSTSVQMTERRAYRIPPETLERVRVALHRYEGSHNFHNFTIAKKFHDMSARRFIKSFTASDPFVRDGTEWLSLKVHGQSFMMHQIRKMVGLVILMVRADLPETEIFAQAVREPKLNLPKAPSLGLLLERVVFDSYNRKVQATATQKGGEDERPPIVFDPYQSEIDAFRESFIYSQIIATEKAEDVFDSWLLHFEAFPEYFPFLASGGKVLDQDCVVRDSAPLPTDQGEHENELAVGDDDAA
ncbi:tRNA pseudouridine synthase 1 [Tieghemiomyces parasiticus]|uniref:tRNA pseudouridine synthase 1 n=1 Tax=Tieghemiomyces parasiticus TaxID=78921 RepID=A0A9W8AC96_9FUNG|nr:tRNA pseudouridine synthase 1 [Tieghemiomyces parasiticus]